MLCCTLAACLNICNKSNNGHRAFIAKCSALLPGCTLTDCVLRVLSKTCGVGGPLHATSVARDGTREGRAGAMKNTQHKVNRLLNAPVLGATAIKSAVGRGP